MDSQKQLQQLTRDMMAGKPIIIFDDPKREGEADMVVHASALKPAHIRQLRQDAGGLVCLVTDAQTGQALGLNYSTYQMKEGKNATLRKLAIPRMPYGDPSPFSVFINSRKTYTGISDDDRCLTIREFEKMVAKFEKRGRDGIVRLSNADASRMRAFFSKSFYAPGHVALLLARSIDKRHGHTELVSALSEAAGLTPAVVICEMLGDNGKALTWKGAKAYAKRHGLQAIDGKTLMNLLAQSRER